MQETPPPIPVDAATGSTVEPIGQSINEGKGRIFPCDSCGADMVFHIGKQLLACQFCGFQKEIVLDEDAKIEEQDYHAMIARIEEIKQKKKESAPESTEEPEDGKKHASEIQCESCGATVVFLGSLTSQECPYCASPIQRDNVHRAKLRIPVDGVLPFKITREKAKSNLESWIRSRWFAPTRFLERKIDEKLKGPA